MDILVGLFIMATMIVASLLGIVAAAAVLGEVYGTAAGALSLVITIPVCMTAVAGFVLWWGDR